MDTLTDAQARDLRRQALIAAYPFGGHALAFQRPVIEALEAERLVKITCTDMHGIGYVLTQAGKTEVSTLDDA